MRRRLPLCATLVVLLLAGTALWAERKPAPVPTREGRSASIEGPVFLRVPVGKKGGIPAAALKYTGDAENAKAIEKLNPRPRKGRTLEVRIPLELLLPAFRLEALSALFPKDKRTASGWDHVWGESPLGEEETWDDVALWFSGSRRFSSKLRQANSGAGRRPKSGSTVHLPAGLLIPALLEIPGPPPAPGPGLPPGGPEPKPAAPPHKEPAVPPQAPPGFIGPPPPPATGEETPQTPPDFIGPPWPPPAAGEAPPPTPGGPQPPAEGPGTPPGPVPSPLTYGQDDQGPYAIYNLQAGEALYSAVVVRFTGNMDADDVNALALEYAKRSGIEDVHSIPVGFPVKIPLDDLLPQYLPQSDSRYVDWAKKQAEVGQFTNTYKNSALEGVVIILDPGHGGLDRGAMKNGVWEDSYVYDITCRIREGLEKRTKARVLMTILEPDLGYKPRDKEKLTPNKGSVILTHPWFAPKSSDETRVEVNLRWVLANQYFERLTKEGIDPQRVIFTSVHADSLHPSLRGTMFYIPGVAYRNERWCVAGVQYD